MPAPPELFTARRAPSPQGMTPGGQVAVDVVRRGLTRPSKLVPDGRHERRIPSPVRPDPVLRNRNDGTMTEPPTIPPGAPHRGPAGPAVQLSAGGGQSSSRP